MVEYVFKRVAAAAVTMFFVAFFTLIIFFVLSPDPAVQICGQTCTPERIDQIRGQLGLDQPFLVQFFAFLGALFVGRSYGEGVNLVECIAPCLGHSFQSGENVTAMITDRLPVTITVAVGASVLWLTFGVVSGVFSALKENTWVDKSLMFGALAGIALPNYFVALLLQFILVVQLQILPFPGAVSFSEDPVRWFQNYLMPWIVLAIMYAAMYTRLTRSNVIDTLGENYIRTARAKGLSSTLVVGRHALRPSLTPIVTMFGMDVAALLGGALITETVFGLNGVGRLAYDAIGTNDQPVIMGVTLFAAFFVISANIVVDLLYSVLDPRVKVKVA